MAAQVPDPERNGIPTEPEGAGPSDLIGLKLSLYLGVGIIAILAAFFLVGPIAGIVVLLAALALGMLGVVAALRRAEEPSDWSD